MKILIVIGLFIAVVVLAKKSAFPSRQDGRVRVTTIRERLSTSIKSSFIQTLIDIGALIGLLLFVAGVGSVDTHIEIAPILVFSGIALIGIWCKFNEKEGYTGDDYD